MIRVRFRVGVQGLGFSVSILGIIAMIRVRFRV